MRSFILRYVSKAPNHASELYETTPNVPNVLSGIPFAVKRQRKTCGSMSPDTNRLSLPQIIILSSD